MSSVAKVIEITASSSESFDDAVRVGIAKASETSSQHPGRLGQGTKGHRERQQRRGLPRRSRRHVLCSTDAPASGICAFGGPWLHPGRGPAVGVLVCRLKLLGVNGRGGRGLRRADQLVCAVAHPTFGLSKLKLAAAGSLECRQPLTSEPISESGRLSFAGRTEHVGQVTGVGSPAVAQRCMA